MLGCAQRQVNVGDELINSRIVGDTKVMAGGQFIQRADPPTAVEPQLRVLWPVFVVVLFRHVVLRHFARAHFSLVRIGRIFHTAHNSRLERLSFF